MTSSDKSSTLAAELRGLQDTAEFRSAPASNLITQKSQRSLKRKRYVDSAIGEGQESLKDLQGLRD